MAQHHRQMGVAATWWASLSHRKTHVLIHTNEGTRGPHALACANEGTQRMPPSMEAARHRSRQVGVPQQGAARLGKAKRGGSGVVGAGGGEGRAGVGKGEQGWPLTSKGFFLGTRKCSEIGGGCVIL